MYKTYTVNISGIVFHIDERAYDALQEYLEAVRNHFSETEGRDEIIEDIEARIAEIFQSKLSERKQVILPEDVEEIITILGRPEDIAGEGSSSENTSKDKTGDTNPDGRRKRLFRDPDDKMLGGVCSGIAYYFAIDPLWIRAAFLLSFLLFGTGLFLYIVLWFIIPQAKTTAEKLEMKGEKVNLSHIEKNIKEELNDLKDRMKEMGKNARSKAEEGIHRFKSRYKSKETQGFFYEILYLFLRAASIIIGILIFAIAFALLIAFLISLFSSNEKIVVTSFGSNFWALPSFINIFVGSASLGKLAIAGIILVVGTILCSLIFSAIRLIFHIPRIPIVSWVVSGLIVSGILISIYVGLTVSAEFTEHGSKKLLYDVAQPKNGILYLQLKPSLAEKTIVAQNGHARIGKVVYFNIDNSLVACGRPEFRFTMSEDTAFHIQLIKSAKGKNNEEAVENASKIEYSIAQKDTIMALGKDFFLRGDLRWRKQELIVLIKIPKGKMIYISEEFRGIRFYDIQGNELWEIDELGTYWLMTSGGLICRSCSSNKNISPNKENNEILNIFDKVEKKDNDKVNA